MAIAASHSGSLIPELFPDEMYLAIFSDFTPSELAICSRVSQKWRTIATNNQLWIETAKKMFLGGIPPTLNFKTILALCGSQKLKNNDEVLDRVRSFMGRISLGQNARFRCILTNHANILHRFQTLSIEIKGSKEKVPPAPLDFTKNDYLTYDFQEDYFTTSFGDEKVAPGNRVSYEVCNMRHGRDCSIGHKLHILTSHDYYSIAVLRFPSLRDNINSLSEMEHAILDMTQTKLHELTLQSQIQIAFMYGVVIGVPIALAIFLMM